MSHQLNDQGAEPLLPMGGVEGKYATQSRRISLLPFKKRLGLLFIILIGVIAFEIFHYHLDGLDPFTDVSFWIEIFIYGIVLPTSVIFILDQTDRRRLERDEALQERDTQIARSQKLNASSTWEDLVNTILWYPSQVLPSEGVYLHVFNPDQAQFELAGAWQSHGETPNCSDSMLSLDNCLCQKKFSQSFLSIAICQSLHRTDENQHITRYCLPLVHVGEIIGLLHIDLPEDITITQKQVRMLTSFSPEIALALNNARLEMSASRWAATETQERQRIASDLHDTLGQNIAFLHFKLDQLSYDDSLKNLDDIRHELEKMRDAANEAYEQMRGTLVKLQPVPNPILSVALLERSRDIGKRAGFTVHLESKGQPVTLAPEVEKQVLYICREALNNIEKHAHAKNVEIQMNWEIDNLSVKISDDGVGFLPDQMLWEGTTERHYGLAIMHERAEQVSGTLTIDSEPGKGTQMTFLLPLHRLPVNSLHSTN